MNVSGFTVHDVTCFPLVKIQTDRLVQGFAAQWMLEMESLVSTEKPFVLLLYEAQGHDESHEDRKQTVLWFKRNRQAFARVCCGIVGIEPNKTKRTLKRAQAVALFAVFGVSVQIAATQDEAEAMARQLLDGPKLLGKRDEASS